MAPSLSVVIPTLNAAGEIDELLTLIETQTLRPFDILVVDSSSEDGPLTRSPSILGLTSFA